MSEYVGIDDDSSEPLQRGMQAEDEETTLERELLLAADAEFREPTLLPGEPFS